jgi:hypothetical protein
MPPSTQSSSPPTDAKDCENLVQKRNECYLKHGLVEDGQHPLNGNAVVANASRSLHHPSSKKCWIPTLKAKRCLAFVHCPRQALSFYVTPSDDVANGRTGDTDDTPVGGSEGGLVGRSQVTSSSIKKGMCASFDEAYCFGNPQLMKIDTGSVKKDSQAVLRQQHQKAVFETHQKSIRRVGNNKQKWKECQELKRTLELCLRRTMPTTS